MKCTNRIVRNICFLSLLCTVVTGCGQQNIPLPFDNDYSVTSFQLTKESSEQVATPFADKLCVTAEDIVEGMEVDLTEAGAAGLFDVTNSKVIYAKNIHEQLYPASLTKIMTALVALKYGKLEDVIQVREDITFNESGVTTCGLKKGDTLTLEQALHALLINSANDAGIVIAEHIAGSVEGFSEMMNAEALAIGATNSHFVNPHGLSDDTHYVTAYDMYLIFNEAMKFERFNEIISMSTYSTVYHDKDGAEKELSFSTTNQYLKGVYDAPDKITVIGGKTGTTNAAQNCLILYAKDSAGNPYISVILRSKERSLLYKQMSDLLDEI